MTHAEQLLDAIRRAPRLLRELRPYNEQHVRRGERIGWTTEQLSEALWRGHRVTWNYDFIEQVVADLARRGAVVQAGGRVKLRPTRRRR